MPVAVTAAQRPGTTGVNPHVQTYSLPFAVISRRPPVQINLDQDVDAKDDDACENSEDDIKEPEIEDKGELSEDQQELFDLDPTVIHALFEKEVCIDYQAVLQCDSHTMAQAC